MSVVITNQLCCLSHWRRHIDLAMQFSAGNVFKEIGSVEYVFILDYCAAACLVKYICLICSRWFVCDFLRNIYLLIRCDFWQAACLVFVNWNILWTHISTWPSIDKQTFVIHISHSLKNFFVDLNATNYELLFSFLVYQTRHATPNKYCNNLENNMIITYSNTNKALWYYIEI